MRHRHGPRAGNLLLTSACSFRKLFFKIYLKFVPADFSEGPFPASKKLCVSANEGLWFELHRWALQTQKAEGFSHDRIVVAQKILSWKT
jgi:hypothetical protein